jgi:hypothetical protein
MKKGILRDKPDERIIRLRAYGHNHYCRLDGETGQRALLIDMGRDGARLRLETPPARPPRCGERCLLHCLACIDGSALAPMAGLVDWRNGQEVGIRFLAPCEVNVRELQRAIGARCE